MRKSITLVELIIAISLLGVILLGVTAFDVASRYFLKSNERKSQIVNEFTFILEHLSKNINQAVGDISNPGIVKVEQNSRVLLHLRQDALRTPNDYSDDLWVTYVYYTTSSGADSYTLAFWPLRQNRNSFPLNSREVLSSRVVSFDFSVSGSRVSINNFVLRYTPDNTQVDYANNPQISITSPISFLSLVHSAN
ncbi:MAG TPA: hypothetical protein ENG49_03615 [Candidatus Omnitrophica bacterium]|nr:hypothetical protein [Candidatus Omnitrophota bacterium]